MSRVLEALKTLESRQQVGSGPILRAVSYAPASRRPRAAIPFVRDEGAVAQEVPVAPASPVAPSRDACLLPTAPVLSDCYLELAERISGQLAENYCNVLLFVTPDHLCGQLFSLAQLAQAFSLQSDGDVLVVDGELRCGRLSQTVGVIGPGMIEVMLGMATWPEVIHPTGTSHIDFAPCGSSEIPSFERPEFGWHALRPKYRAVLIGVSDAHEPETTWLAARCDATYFVISRPHTRRQAATEALDKLRASGASVLGCIVIGD